MAANNEDIDMKYHRCKYYVFESELVPSLNNRCWISQPFSTTFDSIHYPSSIRSMSVYIDWVLEPKFSYYIFFFFAIQCLSCHTITRDIESWIHIRIVCECITHLSNLMHIYNISCEIKIFFLMIKYIENATLSRTHYNQTRHN